MAWTVDIDGTDITSYCQQITWHPKLNRPASCVVRYPAHLFALEMQTAGHELHLYEGATLKFSGPIWFQQPDGTTNSTYNEITAYDHLIHLGKRLCKKPSSSPAGNLIDPSSVITTNVTGPAILEAFIENTAAIDDIVHVGTAPLPLTVNSAAVGGEDLSGVPTNFPMTIEQMRALLCSTGWLNVLVNPGVGSSTLDLTNGGIVTDRSATVSIDYQTGAYNSQVSSWTEDMEDVINALWYLLGPRGPRMGRRVWIPKNHWAGSITPTAPNSGGDGEGPGIGAWPAALVAKFNESREDYSFMQEIRVFDDREDEDDVRPLFEEEWANEAWIRAVPKQLVNIRPQRGSVSPVFQVGDLITVNGGTRLGGGFTGTQVVFEYEVVIDTDGVVDVTSIVASDEQDTGA